MQPSSHRFLSVLAVALVARREFFIRQRSQAEYSNVDVHAAIEVLIVGLCLAWILINPAILKLTAKAVSYTHLTLPTKA